MCGWRRLPERYGSVQNVGKGRPFMGEGELGIPHRGLGWIFQALEMSLQKLSRPAGSAAWQKPIRHGRPDQSQEPFLQCPSQAVLRIQS